MEGDGSSLILLFFIFISIPIVLRIVDKMKRKKNSMDVIKKKEGYFNLLHHLDEKEAFFNLLNHLDKTKQENKHLEDVQTNVAEPQKLDNTDENKHFDIVTINEVGLRLPNDKEFEYKLEQYEIQKKEEDEQKQVIEEERRKQLEQYNIQKIEEDELKWAIEEEEKEKRKYMFYDESIDNFGYCNYYFMGYCHKYNFGPVDCSSRNNEYDCSWKERRLDDYKVNDNDPVKCKGYCSFLLYSYQDGKKYSYIPVNYESHNEIYGCSLKKREIPKYMINFNDSYEEDNYCSFICDNYCTKYNFGPVVCEFEFHEYDCSLKERRIPGYIVKNRI